VQVLVDGGEVFDGTGNVSFGETPTGVPVTKAFSVRNIGGATLELSGPVAVPAGLTLVSGLSATSLAPGGVATFVVRQDATGPGVFAGEVSFGTNDADEATFNFTASGTVAAARVIDDGAPGFSVSGARPSVITQGYQGDARRLGPAYRLFSTRRVISIPRFRSTATWAFGDVEPGTYRVSATWSPGADRAVNAPFTVLNGTTTLASVAVNQRLAPADLTAHGTTWKDLGTFKIDSGSLSVRLTNPTLGAVIADAVRIERVADVTTLSVAAAPPVAAPTRRGALGLPVDRVTNDLIASTALPR
jgi:hypothetical protein